MWRQVCMKPLPDHAELLECWEGVMLHGSLKSLLHLKNGEGAESKPGDGMSQPGLAYYASNYSAGRSIGPSLPGLATAVTITRIARTGGARRKWQLWLRDSKVQARGDGYGGGAISRDCGDGNGFVARRSKEIAGDGVVLQRNAGGRGEGRHWVGVNEMRNLLEVAGKCNVTVGVATYTVSAIVVESMQSQNAFVIAVVFCKYSDGLVGTAP